MPRQPRSLYIDPAQVQIIHAIQRCVRRAFLCGADRHTGQSFEHRRAWIRDRLELLAAVFAIDCLTYAVMSNHVHIVIRTRPDIVATWSDEEIAVRWLKLFPGRQGPRGKKALDVQAAAIVADQDRVTELRRRLSDVSWWMRCLSEHIARRSNSEDQCKGRFWEGRFKAQLILDEASLLACAAYVDLNPVRAAVAKTPEASRYTGAADRAADLRERATARQTPGRDRNAPTNRSGWMSPIQIDEAHDPVGPDISHSGRRASDKGFLSISLADYLEILDWTGRTVREGKRGSVPEHYKPILTRLGVEPTHWCQLVEQFGRLFKRVAGTYSSLSAEAARRGQHYMQGPGARLLIASA